MANEKSKTAALTTQKFELQKVRYFYDAQGRCSHIYQAPVDLANNGVCLVTQYTFTGTETSPTASKEYEGVWNSTWDVTESAPVP